MTTTPLRVLHVNETFWGGIVALLETLVRSQIAAGMDVHVLTPDAGPPLHAGVVRHSWPVSRRRLGSFVSSTRQLSRVAREVQPDVIHLHSFVAGLLGRLPGVLPHSITVVYQPHSWSFERFKGARGWAILAWEKFAAGNISMLITNCQDEISEGERHGVQSRHSTAIGVPVDLVFFRPPSPDERAAAKLALGFHQRPLLAVIGRLAWQKGQDSLVAEWERRPLAEVDIVLVGPGDPTPLRRLAPREWGRSLHHVNGTCDVRAWLWAADVVVMPSRYEGFPMVAAEAMACATTVVTTAFNGAHEAIVNGGQPPGGAVVELGDMAELIAAAGARLTDSELRLRESEAARSRAEHQFAPESVVRRLGDAYGRAARGSLT